MICIKFGLNRVADSLRREKEGFGRDSCRPAWNVHSHLCKSCFLLELSTRFLARSQMLLGRSGETIPPLINQLTIEKGKRSYKRSSSYDVNT